MKNSFLAIGTFMAVFWFILSTLSCGNFRKLPADQVSPTTAQTFYNAALRNIESGAFEKALSNLDSSVAYNHQFATYHRVRGWVLEQLGIPDSAIFAYETSLRYKSDYPEALLSIGRLYLQGRKYDRAIFYLRKMPDSYADSLEIQALLAEAYVRNNNGQLALDVMRAYGKRHPLPSPLYQKWEGIALYSVGKYSQSTDALTTYLQAMPKDVEALKFLGLTQFENQAWDAALTSLNAAYELDPGDADIYLYRSFYFQKMNKPDIAREQLEIGLKQDGMHTGLLFEMGRFNFELNRLEDSRDYFERLVEHDPEHWPAYRYLGLLAEVRQNNLEAASYYRLYLKNIFSEDKDIRQRLERIEDLKQ